MMGFLGSTTRRLAAPTLLVPLILGCSNGVETPYGRSRTTSINGTGALAEMFRARGHEVRAAVRLSDELNAWADVIVRISPYSGPVPNDEANWYDAWLNTQAGRRIVYVPRDYVADVEYWSRALDQLPSDATPRLRERVQNALDQARAQDGVEQFPPDAKEVADARSWFALEPPTPDPLTSPKPQAGSFRASGRVATGPPSQVCADLSGPWAAGVSSMRAAIPFRRWLKTADEVVLLACGSKALAASWTRNNTSRVLILANGSFALNAALAANPGRRPLAERVVDWAGFAGDEEEGESGATIPKRVAFVEGLHVATEPARQPSVFDLLYVEPFGKVAAQLLALGLVAALARAPRLGRALPDEPSGADRPAAHPEALGALLARTGQAGVARSILETYRRWRTPHVGRSSHRPPSLDRDARS
ncbi:MAG: hypothetical protein AB7I30_14385 [Isosphaeraceae bacterium]